MSGVVKGIGKVFSTVAHSTIGKVAIAAAATYFLSGYTSGVFGDATDAAATADDATSATSDAIDASQAGDAVTPPDDGSGIQQSIQDANATDGTTPSPADATPTPAATPAPTTTPAGLPETTPSPAGAPSTSTAPVPPNLASTAGGGSTTVDGVAYPSNNGVVQGPTDTSSGFNNKGIVGSWMDGLSSAAQSILAGGAFGAASGTAGALAQKEKLAAQVAAEERARADVIRRGHIDPLSNAAFTPKTGIVNSQMPGG